MKNQEIAKQIIDFNRTSFNNSYDAAMQIREQAQTATDSFLSQNPQFMAESGKKILDEWNSSVKKGLADFKENVNSGFDKFEDFFSS